MKRLSIFGIIILLFLFGALALANDDDTGPPPELYQTFWKYDPDGQLLDEYNFPQMSNVRALVMSDSDHLYAINNMRLLRFLSISARQIEWEVKALYPEASFLNAAVDANGNYVYAGFSGDDCFVAKYNQSGELLWNWQHNPTINGECEIHDIVIDSENTIFGAGEVERLIGGRDGLVFRLDADGNVLWSKEINSNHGRGSDVKTAVNPQRNLIVSGYKTFVDSEKLYLHTYCFDCAGEQLWHDKYIDEVEIYGNTIEKILVDAQGNTYLFLGRFYIISGKGGPYYLLRIVKYDPMGVLLWTHTQDHFINCYPMFLGQDAQENIIAGGFLTRSGVRGRLFLIKYSPAGELLWMIERGNDIFYQNLLQPFCVVGSDIYVTMNKDEKTVTLKFGPDGELVWTKTHSARTDIRCEDYVFSIFRDDVGNLQHFGESRCYLDIFADDDNVWDDDYYVDDDTDDDVDDDGDDDTDDDFDDDDSFDNDIDDDASDDDDEDESNDDDTDNVSEMDDDNDDNDGCGGCRVSVNDPALPLAGFMLLLGVGALVCRRFSVR